MLQKWALRLPLLVSLALSCFASYGQQQFLGKFDLAGHSGQAEFYYTLADGDTLITGPFKFYSGGIDDLLDKEGMYFHVEGNFNEGLPMGSWRFQFGQLSGGDELRLTGNTLQTQISGTLHTIHGAFDRGLLTGPWVSAVQHIVNSEVEVERFHSRFEFEGNRPKHSFSIENDDLSLMGLFLRDGFAHDTWELFVDAASNTLEEWRFDEGWLRSIKNADEPEIPIFRKDTVPVVEMNIDERYVRLIKARSFLDRGDSLNSDGILDLLAINAEHYEMVNRMIAAVSPVHSVRPELKVKAYEYPLDESELQALAHIKDEYDSNWYHVERLLRNKQIQLLRLADPHVDSTLKQLEHVESTWLLPLGKILDYQHYRILKNIERSALIDQLWNNQTWNEGITKPTASGLRGVAHIAEQITARIEQLTESLDEKLFVKVKQDELDQLEVQMIEKVEIMNRHIDSLMEVSELSVQEQHRVISSRVNERLKLYAGMEDIDKKTGYARSTLMCIEDMKMLADNLSRLQVTKSEILSLYKDKVWNPFTSTLMEETVKKELVEAYTDVLIPYIHRQANDVSCATAGKTIALLERIHARMIDLREEETRKLERKLKKDMPAEQVLRLLNVQPSTATGS